MPLGRHRGGFRGLPRGRLATRHEREGRAGVDRLCLHLGRHSSPAQRVERLEPRETKGASWRQETARPFSIRKPQDPGAGGAWAARQAVVICFRNRSLTCNTLGNNLLLTCRHSPQVFRKPQF